ncbi:YczE/YyaS/YitT family protein [Terribacillus saccharophilus]|uniref:YczE/YyaS/YitT family protein n=1 Tax=Terribacillus saccharophilus TaxID=361277 RepID=UPI003982073B
MRIRGLLFFSGLLLMTLGIALTIEADFGTSPFDAVLVGLAESAGMTVGMWEIILAGIFIMVNSLLTRTAPEIAGLLTAFATGLFLDGWLFLLSGMHLESMISRAGLFLAAQLLLAAGTALYLHTKFAPIPIDRLMLVLIDKLHTSVAVARTFLYAVCLISAFLLAGPIGPGTVLTVLLGGFLLQYAFFVLQRFGIMPIYES